MPTPIEIARKSPNLWVKRDGQIMRIADMNDDHLLNAIRMLHRATNRNKQEQYESLGPTPSYWDSSDAAECALHAALQRDVEVLEPEDFFPQYKTMLEEAALRGISIPDYQSNPFDQ